MTPDEMTPVEMELRRIDQRTAARAPYDELVAALDACESLPGADAAMPRIVSLRLTLLSLYARSDEECARVLDSGMATLERVPLWRRVYAIAAVCVHRLALAEQYLPPLLAALEEEQRAAPADTRTAQAIEHVALVLRRTREGANGP